MFNLSKKTEYGLIALSYLSGVPGHQSANVSEIAGSTALPRELLAKILSELVKAGLAESYPGPAGGFKLTRPAGQVSLAEVVGALERRPSLVDCAADAERCARSSSCTIRSPMARVNARVERILRETMLAEFVPLRKRGSVAASPDSPGGTVATGE